MMVLIDAELHNIWGGEKKEERSSNTTTTNTCPCYCYNGKGECMYSGDNYMDCFSCMSCCNLAGLKWCHC